MYKSTPKGMRWQVKNPKNIFSLTKNEVNIIPSNTYTSFKKNYLQLRSLMIECINNKNCNEEEMKYLIKRLYSGISSYLEIYNKSKSTYFEFENYEIPTNEQVSVLLKIKEKLEDMLEPINSSEELIIRNQMNTNITLQNKKQYVIPSNINMLIKKVPRNNAQYQLEPPSGYNNYNGGSKKKLRTKKTVKRIMHNGGMNYMEDNFYHNKITETLKLLKNKLEREQIDLEYIDLCYDVINYMDQLDGRIKPQDLRQLQSYILEIDHIQHNDVITDLIEHIRTYGIANRGGSVKKRNTTKTKKTVKRKKMRGGNDDKNVKLFFTNREINSLKESVFVEKAFEILLNIQSIAETNRKLYAIELYNMLLTHIQQYQYNKKIKNVDLELYIEEIKNAINELQEKVNFNYVTFSRDMKSLRNLQEKAKLKENAEQMNEKIKKEINQNNPSNKPIISNSNLEPMIITNNNVQVQQAILSSYQHTPTPTPILHSNNRPIPIQISNNVISNEEKYLLHLQRLKEAAQLEIQLQRQKKRMTRNEYIQSGSPGSSEGNQNVIITNAINTNKKNGGSMRGKLRSTTKTVKKTKTTKRVKSRKSVKKH
jgi:hypothetical protein